MLLPLHGGVDAKAKQTEQANAHLEDAGISEHLMQQVHVVVQRQCINQVVPDTCTTQFLCRAAEHSVMG